MSKPKNNITISKGTNTPKIQPDRSFAQPTPSAEAKAEEVKPVAHASQKDELKALEENSKLKKKHEKTPPAENK